MSVLGEIFCDHTRSLVRTEETFANRKASIQRLAASGMRSQDGEARTRTVATPMPKGGEICPFSDPVFNGERSEYELRRLVWTHRPWPSQIHGRGHWFLLSRNRAVLVMSPPTKGIDHAR